MAETIVSGAPVEPTPSGNQLPPGTQLMGMYEIGELVAAGGMGEVYRGRQVATDDEVAIKVIKADMAGNDAAFALFKKEASSLHHLHHEAIVRYFAFGFDTVLKRPFLAMEFVDGESLSDLLKRGPLPFDQALVLLRRVASGLASAHEIGIIHRDISPDNVILKKGQPKRAKIIDFGIAKANNIGGATIIGDGFAGKHNYVSPEQLGLGTGEVTAKSDIYSLGLLMAEVLRGKPLEMSGSHLQIIERRRVVPPLDDIDERIRPLIARMLDPDPDRRPESMQEIAEWKPDQPAPAAAAPAAADGTAESVPPAPRRRGRLTEMEFGSEEDEEEVPRRRWPLVAGLAGLIAAGGIAGFLLTRGLSPGGQADSDVGPDVAIRQPQRPSGAGSPPPTLSMAAPRPAPAETPAPQVPAAVPPAPAILLPPVPAPPAVAILPAAPPQQADPPRPLPAPAPSPAPERPGLTASEIVERLTRPAATPPPTPAPARPAPAPAPVPAPPVPPAASAAPALPPPPAAEPPDAAFSRAFQSGDASEMLRLAEAHPTSPLAAVARAQAEQIRRAADQQRQQVASAPAQAPAPAPAAPVAAPRTRTPEEIRAQPIIDYIRYYNGGRCFFIGPVDVTDSRATVEGYGAEVAPFAAFDRDFQQVNGFEAKVQLRLIAPAQCPVTGLLRRVDQGRDSAFRFDIVDMNIRPGQNLVGQVQGQGGRKVYVILMADDGKLSLLPTRATGRAGALEASVRISQEDITAKKPKIMLAIASEQELATMARIEQMPTERFLEALGDEIAGMPNSVALLARYAVVERR
jgi:serine/threonine-protein kinase